MKEQLLNTVCQQKNALEFIREGVVLEYVYYDRNSTLIYKLKIDSQVCLAQV